MAVKIEFGARPTHTAPVDSSTIPMGTVFTGSVALNDGKSFLCMKLNSGVVDLKDGDGWFMEAKDVYDYQEVDITITVHGEKPDGWEDSNG